MKKNNMTSEEIALEKEQEQVQLEELANKNTIIRVVAGSHAYGTNIPTSDWDERSIFTDNIDRVILPFDKIEQIKYRDDDKVAFELSKYMSLLLTQNPNVIELLWTEEKDVLFKNELGQLLIDNRTKFLSSKVKDTYVGYATSQLSRIKGHNKWINNPQPEREPEQGDFLSVVWNFTNDKNFNKKVPKEGYVAVNIGANNYSLWSTEKLNIPTKSWIDIRGNPNALEKSAFDQININRLSPDIIVKLNAEAFSHHHTNWKMYWQWKKNRNEKRSELEEKFGYDVKHAMHLIRLLRSGIDILEKGIVPVKRDDAQYLLDIRFGKYSYEEIVAESERLTKQVEKLSLTTNLRPDPDYDLAKEIMVNIYSQQWNMPIKTINKIKPF